MSDSERAMRAEAHRLTWEHGMCTASERDSQPQHGTLCTEMVALLAERDRERDALREALRDAVGTWMYEDRRDCITEEREAEIRALAKVTP